MDNLQRPRPQPRWVFGQFALPHGLFGRVAGAVMARGNADMARMAIDLLDPTPTDQVLEIGFGPGIGIELLARRISGGLVAGVDPSPVMLDQALSRNRAALAEGRVDLRLGASDHIPWPNASFDGACSMNNVMLWSLRSDVHEVRRVVRERARLVIAVHEWTLGGESGGALRLGARFPSLDEVLHALEASAFADLDVRRVPTRSGPAVFIIARAD